MRLVQVSLRHLHVIEVELQLEMRRADLVDDLLHLIGGVGEVAGNVAVVDRLHHQREPALGGAVAGLLEVGDEGLVHRLGVGAGRDHARHDVQRAALQHLGVVERLVERGRELGLAAGQGGQPALALAPVARRQVEQRLRELVLLELGRDVGGRRLVGEQDLDGLEAVRGGGAEALQERHLLVDPGEVGGELGHVGLHLDQEGKASSTSRTWRVRRAGAP